MHNTKASFDLDTPPRGLRILIVEDDPTTTHLIQQRLAGSPASIDLIENSLTFSDAIRATQTEAFDIVLLDLGLTDSPSPETTLSRMPELGSIPVVVITGHDGPDMWDKSMSAGAQDFLSKDSFVFRPGGAVYLAHVIVSTILRYNVLQSHA